jgi:uncharacterized protein
MSISMYSASAPVFANMLRNLSHFLTKAQAHADAKKFDAANLVNARLIADMLPFSKQVQIACDAAKLGLARLAGVDAPKFEDNETTLTELKARIDKTLEFIASIKPEQIDGCEEKEITFPVGREATRTMKGEAYLKHWVTPNLYFHVTTAYALLRANGVELGKGDYLMGDRV